MRGFVVTIAGVAAAVCAGAQTPPVYDPHGQLQTPDRSGTSSLTNAAAAPLHDLNIMRQGIPALLLQTLSDPYARPSPMSCAEVAREVEALDVALGADFDQPNTPQDPSLTRNSSHVALALVQSASRLLLPYAGLVRTVTGAQRHDQLIIEAITAGSVRRGYLKGLGEAYRCAPPGTPEHQARPAQAAREDGRAPAYPIH